MAEAHAALIARASEELFRIKEACEGIETCRCASHNYSNISRDQKTKEMNEHFRRSIEL